MTLTKEEMEECKSLTNWAERTDMVEVDAILEWLVDSNYLNQHGQLFARRYWDYCWHNGKHTEEKIKDPGCIDEK